MNVALVNISTGTMVLPHYTTLFNNGDVVHNGLRRRRHAPGGN